MSEDSVITQQLNGARLQVYTEAHIRNRFAACRQADTLSSSITHMYPMRTLTRLSLCSVGAILSRRACESCKAMNLEALQFAAVSYWDDCICFKTPSICHRSSGTFHPPTHSHTNRPTWQYLVHPQVPAVLVLLARPSRPEHPWHRPDRLSLDIHDREQKSGGISHVGFACLMTLCPAN